MVGILNKNNIIQANLIGTWYTLLTTNETLALQISSDQHALDQNVAGYDLNPPFRGSSTSKGRLKKKGLLMMKGTKHELSFFVCVYVYVHIF